MGGCAGSSGRAPKRGLCVVSSAGVLKIHVVYAISFSRYMMKSGKYLMSEL
jgi:hypothetical protein